MPVDARQARVLGALVEKAMVTPQQYPLTLNALVAACNQASNREPVTELGADAVRDALAGLKDAGLVRFVLPSHGRSAVRYRHVLDEALGLDPPGAAVLALLLLRGRQTVGELRARTERLFPFADATEVAEVLARLGGGPGLVRRLERRPGQKEERWAETLSRSDAASDDHYRQADTLPQDHEAGVPVGGPNDGAGAHDLPPDRTPPSPAPALRSSSPSEPQSVETLARSLAQLVERVAVIEARLGALQDALGG